MPKVPYSAPYAEWPERRKKLARARSRRWANKNRERVRGWDRKNARRTWRATTAEALRTYGTDPTTCGCPRCPLHKEADTRFLTLSHPDGGGGAHRRALTGNSKGGGWVGALKRRGWPTDPRIIVECWNCNEGRKVNGGVCPHLTPDSAPR